MMVMDLALVTFVAAPVRSCTQSQRFRLRVSLGLTAGVLIAMALLLSTAPLGVVPIAGIVAGGVP